MTESTQQWLESRGMSAPEPENVDVPDAAGPVGPATERRHKIPTDAEMEAAAMRILNQDLEIERLTAELATLRADRDRYRDVARAVAREYEALPYPEGDDGTYARLGDDTGDLESAVRTLAAAVRALGEKP